MMTPELLADHDRNDAPRDQPGAFHIDVEHRVPGLFGELVGEAVGADAGVVEQDVDAAEAIRSFRPRRR